MLEAIYCLFKKITVLLFLTFSSTITLNGQVKNPTQSTIKLIILGNLQDGGRPHIACIKSCCIDLSPEMKDSSRVVSLGVIDLERKKTYLFEATPDISEQLRSLSHVANTSILPDGIFLTHAHMGHYSGLMFLGKEAVGARDVPVYAMPRMQNFLENNGPWSQLVTEQNITIKTLQADQAINLGNALKVIPFLVPHRDEFSETVGFKIIGPNKTVLFIPDINKWEIWEQSIVEEIAKVDMAFIDATFFDENEINQRDMSEIPHPFIVESMNLFQAMDEENRNKIHFIHFNHSNPVLDRSSEIYSLIRSKGYHISQIHDIFDL